jgi:hypothetical protein
MTRYGRLNLIAVLGMPIASVTATAITPALDQPYVATFISVFVMNLVPMAIGGAVTGLLLRSARKAGGAGGSIALLPSVGTAVTGGVWYLWRAFMPDPVAPGVEYIAAPQSLLLLVVALSVLAWIGCLIARSRRRTA